MEPEQQPPRATRSSAEAAPKDQDNALLAPKEKSQANGSRKSSGQPRICTKCGLPLHGQFVRALEGTFHLECFTCNDCGKIVASKFFPVPEQGPDQYPLCEVDYFKRLNLLCRACGGALRGSYITALQQKYHIEHFTCSVCPTVFGAEDNYYEHEGNVFCHYHYSTKFAQRCNGCQTSILKQFVEIFRNGEDQHWHPECYMIHKYWNVRLHAAGEPLAERPSIEGDATEEERKRVRLEEERIEEKVLWIWRTLSQYEERAATCISDMLLHVSNGAYVDGVMSAKRFIVHVDLLFSTADHLDILMSTKSPKGLSYSREAKLLCKKVVAFFQLLAQSQDTGVRRLGVTQELLSLVTGLAHYLKLLVRICLQGTLKYERETGSEEGLRSFLDEINSLDTKLDAEASTVDGPQEDYVNLAADTCPICSKAVEDRCFRQKANVFHYSCMKCESCLRDLAQDADGARWNAREERLLCTDCVRDEPHVERGFTNVSRLQQYVHLLRVAHARLLNTLRTSGALPHTSDDPNLLKYDSETGHRPHASQERLNAGSLRNESRSKSYTGRASSEEQPASYEQTLSDIRRLRSTRMDKQLSNATRRARTSRIIDGPDPADQGAEGAERRKSGFHIIQDRDSSTEPLSQLAFEGADSIRLDDIPRIVAAEQAKDQRPNATKYARGGLVQQEPQPKVQTSTHRREASGAQELEKLGPEGHRPKRYFSELSALEYFIVRHVAVLSMEPLLDGLFNQEELLDLIEIRKPTFWGKFGKAFQKSDKPRVDRSKADKSKGKRDKKQVTFGVPLEALVEREGAESTDGVGPGALRIPALIQDAVSAMRTMDMSMEGVFRKNGNIRRLKEMAEAIDTKGQDSVDLNVETPVQVAALLKKFLRELPDPVMTYKLHRLFIGSQKIQDADRRRRVLHLSCCLLPKSHRDTMEVLFCFLNWAASFSVVDEETGSKMDVHNLATVIAPNILFSNNKTEGMEDSFLAIEAVHSLIQFNETMCEVPEDLQSILNDSSLFSGSADITTKEILKRYGDVVGKSVSTQSASGFVGVPHHASSSLPGSQQQGFSLPIRQGTDPMASPYPTATSRTPQNPNPTSFSSGGGYASNNAGNFGQNSSTRGTAAQVARLDEPNQTHPRPQHADSPSIRAINSDPRVPQPPNGMYGAEPRTSFNKSREAIASSSGSPARGGHNWGGREHSRFREPKDDETTTGCCGCKSTSQRIGQKEKNELQSPNLLRGTHADAVGHTRKRKWDRNIHDSRDSLLVAICITQRYFLNMAPTILADLLAALPTDPSWGPPPTSESTLDGVPYAPFSKGDKLGRMADWTSEGKDREGRGGRQNYGRNYRDQQVYGAGTSSLFAVQAAEDESTFSVVDNTRTSARGRGFGRGGGTVFRGRGGARGGPTQNQRGGRGGTFQRVGNQRGGQQGGYDNQRGGRGGRGGRRFGWKDYDKPQRNRDPSVNVRADWQMLEEIDFARLGKLNLDIGEADDLDSYGFLFPYDRALDRNPGAKTSEKRLQVIDRALYNITTSSDPIIQDFADNDEATVFATDNILSMLMCAPRSVYSWDLILERRGNKLFIDKREGSALDMVTVNENAADAPLELSEGNKDTINAPAALQMEATHINNVFPLTCVLESASKKVDMAHENPFYDTTAETDPPASKAYRYRRFDLSGSRGADDEATAPLRMVVRTELDAVADNPLAKGEQQRLTIHALNEFDNKAQGSGGALDWRTKLASQRGAVVATEMKNNSCKLARWTTQAVLAGADLMKLGFVGRVSPRDNNHHVVLGVLGYKPREFAAQMNLNLGNGWGIVRTIVDMVLGLGEGDAKYVLVKDPNKPLLRLYEVPAHTFDEDDEVDDVAQGSDEE
ncbi:hypothetical protein FH972_023923 [Carpinus fangiana]|uniref:Eukaryotic translation initiation factor 3 subunit D n=1 Tax=Carpinus fangiana TaxID=176857 RepID=A0A5N6KZ29_9ROSI|nr:hypothetical protein FH972_023923 [Carpinus fangiana]